MKYISTALLLLLLSCKPAPDNQRIETTEVVAPLILLDSTAAAAVIAKDEQEGFFEKVGITDMLIQMKQPYRDSINRDSLLLVYKAFLKTEVLDFSEDEIRFCQDVFNEIYPQLQSINPNIFPKDLQLIKLKGFAFKEQVIIKSGRD